MTPRFRTALAVLAALLFATGAVALLAGPGLLGEPEGPGEAGGPSWDGRARTLEGVGASGEGPALPTAGGREGAGPGARIGADGLRGARVPEGQDLSDPREVRRALAEALAHRPVDWRLVAHLVGLAGTSLDPEVRAALLSELRSGNRVGAQEAFVQVRDPSIVRDLFLILDEPELSPGLRSSVISALARMAGADAAEVVRGLEARLVGDLRADGSFLNAIAVRGGREAARALVEYLERSPDPTRIPIYVLGMDLARDAQAREVVVQALARTQDPKVLVMLAAMSGRTGADDLVGPVRALDGASHPPEVRRAALHALGRIGTEGAIAHLLEVARQPGSLGDAALQALRQVGGGPDAGATVEARAKLVAAAAQAQEHPRGTAARVALLGALGNLSERGALPIFVRAMGDPDVGVRTVAIHGLGNLGEAGRPHVDTLIDLWARGDEHQRRSVANALGGIGGDRARSALQQMLQDRTLPEALRRTVNLALRRLEDAEGQSAAEASGPALGGRGR